MKNPEYPNIAFIGKAGSGKDSAAKLLIDNLDYRRLAFADELRSVAVALWGTEARDDRERLQALGQAVREIDPETWVSLALRKLMWPGAPNYTGPGAGVPRLLEVKQWPRSGVMDPRPINQVVAEDGPLPKVASNMTTTEHAVAITDCRYRNEAWRLKGENFIIVRVLCDRNERINRLRANGKLGPDGWEEHISETDLDDWPADYQIRNDASTNWTDLFEQLTNVLRQEADLDSTSD